MRTCFELLYPNDQNSDGSQPSASESGSKSDEIESSELELEWKALREQQQNMFEMSALQAQLEKFQHEIQLSKLMSRRQQLQTRKLVLEEHGVDERDHVGNVLDARSMNSLIQCYHDKPPAQYHASSLRLEQSDVEIIATTIAKAGKSSKLPPPKPKIFTGNELEFMNWEVF